MLGQINYKPTTMATNNNKLHYDFSSPQMGERPQPNSHEVTGATPQGEIRDLPGNIILFKGDDDELEVDKVPLDEVEPISNMTFTQLIQDAFSQNKGVIVGRMQTRDRINYLKSFYHHFYAPNLVRLLFKKPMMNLGNNGNGSTDEPLISRYHTSMPLTVRNPLNNEIIVGEVEFYLLECQASSDLTEYYAKFIGTDFNYANSNEFRKMFLDQSIESDDLK